MAISLDVQAPIDVGRSDPEAWADRPTQRCPFTFSGNAREYFGIWTVNMTLTLLTLGVYSAWAKVRKHRYFYGNTVLEQSTFGYHARPVQILKGRLIAVGAIAAYLVIVAYEPLLDFVVYLVILPLMVPLIMVRALRFNRRIASYRHIRFQFDGTKLEAFVVYLLLWFGPLLSVGLLYPYAAYRLRRFLVEHSRFGKTEFGFRGTAGGYYRPYAQVLVVGLTLGGIALGILYRVDDAFVWRLLMYPLDIVLLGLLAIMSPGLLVAAAYLNTHVENYAWCHTRLGSDRFQLELEFGQLLWIYLTNVLAIMASFGLMIPWAKVRLARYKLSRLCLLSTAGLDGHVAAGQESIAATGEELGGALGLDLGL